MRAPFALIVHVCVHRISWLLGPAVRPLAFKLAVLFCLYIFLSHFHSQNAEKGGITPGTKRADCGSREGQRAGANREWRHVFSDDGDGDDFCLSHLRTRSCLCHFQMNPPPHCRCCWWSHLSCHCHQRRCPLSHQKSSRRLNRHHC